MEHHEEETSTGLGHRKLLMWSFLGSECMFFGSLMMLLFWGGIILLIVLAVRWFGSGPSHGKAPVDSRNKALDILQERFARGEIDKEDYEERRGLLPD